MPKASVCGPNMKGVNNYVDILRVGAGLAVSFLRKLPQQLP